ncbi:MAG: pectate lyase [Prevotella sp.]|nr:pectate lyase [Prevotella sp.]
MTIYNRLLTVLTILAMAIPSRAGVRIKSAAGWLETAWAEWELLPGASSYNVYVNGTDNGTWTRLDNELVRNYGTYGRADAPGLRAGTYSLKVVPVINGTEADGEASVAGNLQVKPHDRTGYAHFGRDNSGLYEGVGAYKNDGTLKDNAMVIYITAANAKTVSVTLPYTETSTKTYTGFYGIIEGYRKCLYAGGMKRPLVIRLIGTVTADDMDKTRFGQGLDIKGEKEYTEFPFTLEGIGNDATIYGFGVQFSQITGAEMRNIGIILCKDDGIELNKHNSHVWLHNLDLFYGQVGSDADQVKGDGAIDIKYSSYCTVAYNHFFDNGKCCLIDPSKSYGNETPADFLTYHHNWFDHADSRLPRCRHGKAFHVYNNYYDGNGEYGVGLASNACAFVEANYFRNCRYPIINSGQGTDKNLVDAKQSKKGLLSGEDGGVCKFWNNHVEGAKSFITQKDTYGSNLYDAYLVDSRDEKIPESVKALKAELVKTPTTYSNFDTSSGMIYVSAPDSPEDIPAIVTGEYGAGRCQKGDFTWTFDNATEDANKDVIPGLKTALTNYRSSLLGFFGGTTTGMSLINGDTGGKDASALTHDLGGRRVNGTTKGIIISNGRKYINR